MKLTIAILLLAVAADAVAVRYVGPPVPKPHPGCTVPGGCR